MAHLSAWKPIPAFAILFLIQIGGIALINLYYVKVQISENGMPVLAIANVEVKLTDQCMVLRAIFLNWPDFASLLGREWIANFDLLSMHKTELKPVPTSLTTLLTE